MWVKFLYVRKDTCSMTRVPYMHEFWLTLCEQQLCVSVCMLLTIKISDTFMNRLIWISMIQSIRVHVKIRLKNTIIHAVQRCFTVFTKFYEFSSNSLMFYFSRPGRETELSLLFQVRKVKMIFHGFSRPGRENEIPWLFQTWEGENEIPWLF